MPLALQAIAEFSGYRISGVMLDRYVGVRVTEQTKGFPDHVFTV